MGRSTLSIQQLYAKLENGPEIIKNLNLTIKPGETHVIMGPNGAGKSTLANVIMGHPDFKVSGGDIRWDDESLVDLSTDERARRGLFLSFQMPEEIDGITMKDFIRAAMTASEGAKVPMLRFRKLLAEALERLDLSEAYADRYVNFGFSGGEKKKSEILQLLMIRPKLAILDETDSGLDVDAVKTVTKGVSYYKEEGNSLLIISHSTRLLEDLPVDYVHILVDGTIVNTGGKELIRTINTDGFSAFSSK